MTIIIMCTIMCTIISTIECIYMFELKVILLVFKISQP